MSRFLVLLILPLMLTGCFGLGDAMGILDEARERAGEVSDKTAEGAAKAIDAYCDAVPADKRLDLRESINSRTSRGDIAIECE